MNREEKETLERDFTLKNHKYSDLMDAWSKSHKIFDVINEKGFEVGVEIGVAYGNHSDNILDKTKIKKWYGVDPYVWYEDYKKDGMSMGQDDFDTLHDFVEKRLSFYGYRFELIRDYSRNALGLFTDGSLDIVYIDGNHSRRYVKKDIRNWWEKVRVGGVLSGHDYNHVNTPWVTTEVNKFAKYQGRPVEYMGDHVWYIEKTND